ncbi:MAG: hypothetical protein ACOYNZ_02495 [Rhodoferax sp.]
MPDEFVWDRYRRDGSSRSANCLQARISAYLHKHSAKFTEQYGREYDELIANCHSNRMNDGDKHCANCPMHPRLSAKDATIQSLGKTA